MARFVALLRGVNVGKAKRVAMADLRALLESLGYSGVRTLLNSGNAVFDGPVEPQAKNAQRIQAAVASELGVDAMVIVKSAKDMATVVAGNKLAATATDPSRLLVAVTNDSKALAALESLAKTDWGSDKVHVGTHAAYVWCANGILESKVAVALLKGHGPIGYYQELVHSRKTPCVAATCRLTRRSAPTPRRCRVRCGSPVTW